MIDHADFAPEMATFNRQNTIPQRQAAALTYEAGFALGLRTRSEDGNWIRPLLLDARVLTARHGNCAAAGLLMSVAEGGLRGLLHGAGYYLEAGDGDEAAGDAASVSSGLQGASPLDFTEGGAVH